MDNKNFLKSIFSIKQIISTICMCLLFINSTHGQATEKDITRLAQECSDGKVESCEKLADIAKNDEKWDVRLKAIKKLTDQNVLIDIAKNDEKWNVRWKAVEKITDQSVLADIAKKDEDSSVRKAALHNITDQNVLADIAKNDNYRIVRETDLEKITDQSALIDIAKNAKNFKIRKMAVEKITDQSVLADICTKDKHDQVQYAAFKRITDQNVLNDIAKNAKNSYRREMAVEKITDQSVLADIAKNDEDLYVREAALKKITDKDTLKDIAEKAEKKEKAEVEDTPDKGDSGENTLVLDVASAVKKNSVTFQTGTTTLSNQEKTGDWLVVTVTVTPPNENYKVIPVISNSHIHKLILPSGIGGVRGSETVFLEYKGRPGVSRYHVKGSANWIGLNDRSGNYAGAGYVDSQNTLMVILDKNKKLQFLKTDPLKICLVFDVSGIQGPYALYLEDTRIDLRL